ncbi:hypothetical protein DRP53_08030 [candidate division WOR-3 bacterium]|uniref:DUF5320 domain-containing protein n=1 Tax=candidate division WOR-3 bacterium TaxID=2052148 RepID=A0A660SFD4_UNCW3|nr:MAG: hypothetical protein DRP53_08030 [candidate division WOR-3 bacterium]
MTGLPGWMRFGFSPGWLGWNPYGMGPAAHYFRTGYWPIPQMNYLWQSGQVPGFPAPYDPWGAAASSPEREFEFLKAQAEVLEDELEGIRKRIAELEGGSG